MSAVFVFQFSEDFELEDWFCRVEEVSYFFFLFFPTFSRVFSCVFRRLPGLAVGLTWCCTGYLLPHCLVKAVLQSVEDEVRPAEHPSHT